MGQGHTPFNHTTVFGDLNFAIWHIIDNSVEHFGPARRAG